MRISPPFLPCKNKIFDLFFLQPKFHTIRYKKQEKKVQKNFILVLKNSVKKKKIFHGRFFTAVFFNSGQFSPNLKPYSDRSRSTQHCFKKSGGVMGRLF
jgi:hypothetical protein